MIEKFITSFETTPMTLSGWIAGFAGILWIRFLLESFSSPSLSGYLFSDLPTLLHYSLFYVATIVVLVVSIGYIARIDSEKMLRTALFLLPLIWLAPLIDLARGGARMLYIFAATPALLLRDFLAYFGGVTLGLRIELGVLLFTLGVYLYVRTRRLVIVGAGVVTSYVVLFFFGSLPSTLSFLMPAEGMPATIQQSLIAHTFLHPTALYAESRTAELLFSAAMAQSLYLILCIAGVALLYRMREEMLRAIMGNMRTERIAHYIVMMILGALIALSGGSAIHWTILDCITIAVAVATLLFAILFAIATNDLADEAIDTVSSPGRPLITGALTRAMMRDIGLVSGLMALVGALTLGSYATFWVLLFSAAYYIYSAPPLRLKRVPVLASALIGVATLAALLLGFFLVSANQMRIAFPLPIGVLVVLFMTLVANIRDLKDIEGDAAAGIKTLPTLLGERRSRMVIGAMTFVAALLVPLFIPIQSLWPLSILAGAVSWIGLVLGRGERFLFTLYFTYLAGVVFLLASV